MHHRNRGERVGSLVLLSRPGWHFVRNVANPAASERDSMPLINHAISCNILKTRLCKPITAVPATRTKKQHYESASHLKLQEGKGSQKKVGRVSALLLGGLHLSKYIHSKARRRV